MKLFKKVLAGVAVAAALATSAQASMITVGGITWDPDFSGSLSSDEFTATYTFTQWFTTLAGAVGTAVNANPTPSNAIAASSAVAGDVLQGVGKIDTINGTTNFAGTGELTFVFGGFTAAAGPSLNGGWLKIYQDSSADFNNLTGSGANDGSLWLSLASVNNTYVGSAFNAATVTSYYSVVGGVAAGNFEDASMLFGGYDAQSTAQAQFNNPKYASSTGTMYSNSIPEPESLALVGLGLLGLAASRRRKSVK
jgi:hypothetical protein